MDSAISRLVEAFIGPGILWVIFAVALSIYGIFTWIMFFHWDSYLVRRGTTTAVKSLYVVVSMGFIASALVSLIAI